LKDCPGTWDAGTTRAAYLKARVVLRRLLSGNIDYPGMREVAIREAEEAMNPMREVREAEDPKQE
jgi:hypothetical protein